MDTNIELVRKTQAAANQRIAELIAALDLTVEEKAFAEILGHQLIEHAMATYAATILKRDASKKTLRPLCAAAALAYALTAAEEFVKLLNDVPEQHIN